MTANTSSNHEKNKNYLPQFGASDIIKGAPLHANQAITLCSQHYEFPFINKIMNGTV